MTRVCKRVLIRRFWRAPGARKVLLAEATVFLAVSRAALVLVPFGRIAARLGRLVDPATLPVDVAGCGVPQEVQVANDVGWAVRHAARHVPFEAVCLPQAIAARLMLKRRGVACRVHFGVATHTASGNHFEAHAWLDAAGIEVIGYPVARDFVEIARFV